MDLFCGNLNKMEISEQSLRELFAEFGGVGRVSIVLDHELHEPRGFGFVQMLDDAEAQKAIEALDGRGFQGRILRVAPAHPRPDRQ